MEDARGPVGRIYGLDMLAPARTSAEQAGVNNVEFPHCHIEDVPLPAAAADIVISNCVTNI
ncbi:methyltransferase domain-containing protein [Nonomuraea diastatica]|uniref:Methyltransferase domain-containing protein n=1 Tax=Nonomuraea diastatica TaxID=1848329 RepID=A0A4V2YET8_9ACTN|nr:methyltransferase domain-containing protein [Nonomuraea diastatica]TDD20547.1 methyltransferase domain-containing protein [Nonomuraea diastatica]